VAVARNPWLNPVCLKPDTTKKTGGKELPSRDQMRPGCAPNKVEKQTELPGQPSVTGITIHGGFPGKYTKGGG